MFGALQYPISHLFKAVDAVLEHLYKQIEKNSNYLVFYE